MNADHSFPIHEYEGWIINGVHRITKIWLYNQSAENPQDFITVKRLKTIPESAILE